MLMLILDRAAAIERIVVLATDPRVPEQFSVRALVDGRRSIDLFCSPTCVRTGAAPDSDAHLRPHEHQATRALAPAA